MKKKHIKLGLIVAGIMNFSPLVLSRGFTNITINNADPVVMSNFGLLMIVIWGMAYISAASINSNIKWLVGVFAIEKLIYSIIWVKWILHNNLSNIFSNDIFAGLFYSIYGINDFIFMLFFVLVFKSEHKEKNI